MGQQASGPQQSSGPGGMFGSSMQASEGTPHPYLQQVAQPPPSQPIMGLGGPGIPQPPGQSAAALAQGQQPILNVSLGALLSVTLR